jgi:Flp pilus assembly pilin Flp
MRRILQQRARALARDERGASIVELALLTPLLATMMLGMVDLGQALAVQHDLQRAANRAVELANTRIVSIDPSATLASYEFVRLEAVNAAGVDDGDVTLSRWRECNNVVQPAENYNGVCDNAEDEAGDPILDEAGNPVPQEVARYLKVEISSTYEPMFSFGPIALSSAADADGNIPISASAAVRIQ